MSQTKVQKAFAILMQRIAEEYIGESEDAPNSKVEFVQYVNDEFAKEVLPLVDESNPVPVRPIVLTQTGKKRVSGYNVYTGAELKKGTPMRDVGPAWKALSDAEKEQWIEQANARNQAKGLPTNNKQKGKRPLNGYNLYTKAFIKQLGGMTAVGADWKKLTQPERDQWKAKATEANGLQLQANEQQANEPKKKRALTGYNLFTRENMKKLGGTMTAVAAAWKELTDPDKEEWKTKAKA